MYSNDTLIVIEMIKIIKTLFLLAAFAISGFECTAQGSTEEFKVLVLAEFYGPHRKFTDAGIEWMQKASERMNFKFTTAGTTDDITKDYLLQFSLIIQMDYPPYAWTKAAEEAFQYYIDEGKGGWIGFHHATLLGEFDGYPLWHWYSHFIGGIRFKNYIAGLASGKVTVEDREHPVMKGVNNSFTVPDEEWYTFNQSPRPNVHVLASVDEQSYRPSSDIRMGDHPVVWTNPHKAARNVYFLMGHDASLFDITDFTRMFENAITWASSGKDEAQSHYPANYAQAPRFNALIYYDVNVEEAHLEFAKQGVEFFRKLSYGNGYSFDVVTNLTGFTCEKLSTYDIVVMLNASPKEEAIRMAFRQYMENGGGWLGFHAAAYNDRHTNWSWFVDFLGGSVFYCNNWPPQPVKLTVDNEAHPVTKNLPPAFIAPESEWYQWQPSPRKHPDIEVLLTLSRDNYPLGIKDVVTHGDFPVVWTNKKYRMLYLNMGHGDDEFTDATQKLLFVNAFRWVLSTDRKGNPFLK